MNEDATFTPTLAQRARLAVTGHLIMAVSRAIPGFTLYGGATITQFRNGGHTFICCCARNNKTGAFGLWIFMDGVPTSPAPLCSGRGSINGTGRWIGWEGNTYREGAIPGWVQ